MASNSAEHRVDSHEESSWRTWRFARSWAGWIRADPHGG